MNFPRRDIQRNNISAASRDVTIKTSPTRCHLRDVIL